MNEQEWLGEQNQLGMDIWKNKYCNNGETFEQWIDRVSGHDEDVAQLLKEQKFLFGGRILANRGLEYEGKKITGEAESQPPTGGIPKKRRQPHGFEI